jgi:hypothetical protein
LKCAPLLLAPGSGGFAHCAASQFFDRSRNSGEA